MGTVLCPFKSVISDNIFFALSLSRSIERTKKREESEREGSHFLFHLVRSLGDPKKFSFSLLPRASERATKLQPETADQKEQKTVGLLNQVESFELQRISIVSNQACAEL